MFFTDIKGCLEPGTVLGLGTLCDSYPQSLGPTLQEVIHLANKCKSIRMCVMMHGHTKAVDVHRRLGIRWDV